MCIRGAAERAGQLNPRAQERTGGNKMRQVVMSERERGEEKRGVERGRKGEEGKGDFRGSLGWIKSKAMRLDETRGDKLSSTHVDEKTK